jgi:hypothetical protein
VKSSLGEIRLNQPYMVISCGGGFKTQIDDEACKKAAGGTEWRLHIYWRVPT